MSSPAKWAVDRQAGTLAPRLGFAQQLGPIYQSDVKDLIIQVLDPSTSLFSNDPYTIISYAGSVGRVTLSTLPKGDGSQTVLAQNTNLVWDAANNWFAGALDLTWAILTATLAANSELPAYLEIGVRINGITSPLLQQPITVKAVADQGLVNNNPSVASFMTLAEARAMFLTKGPSVQDNKVWLSPDGSKARVQYLGNDGDFHYDFINPAPAAQ